MDSDKKNLVLGIIIVAIVMTIGISYAYFTANTSSTGDGSEINASTIELIKVEYAAGESLTLTNAIPGDDVEKVFTVKVTPTSSDDSVKYNIIWDITENTFAECDAATSAASGCKVGEEELKWELYLDGEEEALNSGYVDNDENEQTITLYTADTGTLATTTTYEYKLVVTFIDTEADQNHNAEKTLSGTIEVELTS